MPDKTTPDHPMLLGDGTYNDRTELHLLVEEYAHLREEVERLREEQKTLKERQDKGNQGGKSNDEKGDGKEEKGGKQDQGEDGEKDEEKKDQPKEPFLRRASAWSKAHPLAVLSIVVGFIVLVI